MVNIIIHDIEHASNNIINHEIDYSNPYNNIIDYNMEVH